jgi:hypothetical protein
MFLYAVWMRSDDHKVMVKLPVGAQGKEN